MVPKCKEITDPYSLCNRDVRKVKPFLGRLETMRKDSTYYALDLSRLALEENMRQLMPSYRIGHRYEFVQCFGLWGTFDDAHSWAKKIVDKPRRFCSLGSQFGNDHFDDAVAFLSKWAQIMRPEDRMLIGMDGSEDKEAIWHSYHDWQGLFEEFIRKGYTHSNTVAGATWKAPSALICKFPQYGLPDDGSRLPLCQE